MNCRLFGRAAASKHEQVRRDNCQLVYGCVQLHWKSGDRRSHELGLAPSGRACVVTATRPVADNDLVDNFEHAVKLSTSAQGRMLNEKHDTSLRTSGWTSLLCSVSKMVMSPMLEVSGRRRIQKATQWSSAGTQRGAMMWSTRSKLLTQRRSANHLGSMRPVIYGDNTAVSVSQRKSCARVATPASVPPCSHAELASASRSQNTNMSTVSTSRGETYCIFPPQQIRPDPKPKRASFGKVPFFNWARIDMVATLACH
jgi:hypothetical protein